MNKLIIKDNKLRISSVELVRFPLKIPFLMRTKNRSKYYTKLGGEITQQKEKERK